MQKEVNIPVFKGRIPSELLDPSVEEFILPSISCTLEEIDYPSIKEAGITEKIDFIVNDSEIKITDYMAQWVVEMDGVETYTACYDLSILRKCNMLDSVDEMGYPRKARIRLDEFPSVYEEEF